MERLEKKRLNVFVDAIVGVIPVAIMFVIVLLLSLGNLNFYLPQNAGNIARQSAVPIAMAMSVCVTVRAKGPDFSIGTVTLLSMLMIAYFLSRGVALPLALLVAFAAAGGIGLLNGWLGTKIPVVFATMITGFGFYFIVRYFFATGEYSAGGALDGIREHLFFLVLICAVIPVFLFIFRSRLGLPFAQRKNDKSCFYILPYVISSLLGCLAGVILLARVNVALITSTSGMDAEWQVVFLALCLYASKLWDNKWLPVFAVMLVSWLNVAFENAMTLMRLIVEAGFYVNGLLLAVLVVAVVLRWVYHQYGWGMLSNRLEPGVGRERCMR
ncbi:hypothetical protein LJC56_08900 [Christensenellaceae bacterium OttesenSCG-928-K19]|nr:hypothetical protein [Christensenellaceae bacterium OttesenSCG-928-K19]